MTLLQPNEVAAIADCTHQNSVAFEVFVFVCCCTDWKNGDLADDLQRERGEGVLSYS